VTRWVILVAIGALSIAALTSGCARLGLFKRPAPVTLTKGPAVGSSAPDIEGEDFAGKRFKLSDYRGKVVVVSFWASWCKPCRDLIPHERALAEKFASKNFVLLGVNLDDDPAAAERVIAKTGITWRHLRAGGEGNSIQQRWPVELLPTVYLIDAKGTIRYARVSGHHLENAVETLLAE